MNDNFWNIVSHSWSREEQHSLSLRADAVDDGEVALMKALPELFTEDERAYGRAAWERICATVNTCE